MILLTGSIGCVSVPMRHPARSPQPLPDEVAARYAAPAPSRFLPEHRAQAESTATLVRTHRRYTEWLIQFPLIVSTFEPTEPVVEVEWFESTHPGRRPAILFNPILGGDYPLERGIARFFAAHGFHTALVHRKTLKISPEHEIARLELLLHQAVMRARQVVDWMASHDRVDPARLGSFGISMGGIVSVIIAALEPRLSAHVIVLAGGSIPDILVTSHDPLLTKPVQRYLTAHQMTRTQFAQQARHDITTDPMRFAPYVATPQLLCFVALFDRTIGRANASRLRHALGTPSTVFLPFGHYTSYLALPYLKSKSLRFFKRKLTSSTPRS